MNKPIKIIVTPISSGGFNVEIDEAIVGCFKDGGTAAAHYALQFLEVKRLRKIIDDHTSWLHSRTPEQAKGLDSGTMQMISRKLREEVGLVR